MNNIVAILGRPNVGKSTLFNRLTETRRAIVDEIAGVTRDRQYGKAIWNGKEFSVIDTGGYVKNSDDIFEEEIRKQAMLAIEESDAIIFCVDVMNGITDMDQEVANLLRRIDKPVFICVNKADNHTLAMDATEFYAFGLGEPYAISAINGSGTGDLLDAVVASLPDQEEEEHLDIPHFTFVGRPNVGKSSTVNALLGEDRFIVTDIAGTTRDSVNTRYQQFGYDFVMVDTAGLRRKAKVKEDLEFYSVLRSVRSIESSDVCILILDGTRTIDSQDVSIFHLIERNNKGVVVVVNKWDLVKKDTNTTREYEKNIKERFAPFSDIPIVFTSALTKQRIFKALDTAVEVYENRVKKISTSALNDYLLDTIEAYPPPAHKGKYIKIKYVTQLPTHYPCFAFYANLPQYVKEPYKRYLENKIRERFDFNGVPIRIFIRQK